MMGAVTNETREAIGRLFDAVEQGDIEAVMAEVELVAGPDITATSLVGTAVEGRGYEGLEGIREWLGDMIGAFDLDYGDRELREGPDGTLVFLANLSLTGKSSTAEVGQELAFVFETGPDGKVTRVTTMGSHADALRMGGVEA